MTEDMSFGELLRRGPPRNTPTEPFALNPSIAILALVYSGKCQTGPTRTKSLRVTYARSIANVTTRPQTN